MKKRIFIFCIFLGLLTAFVNLKENISRDIGYLENTVGDKAEVLENSIDDVRRAVEDLKY
ncbi:hypothetical protein HMPREF0946_00826 [Fusobacterium vincentii 3_1_36A2]|jgi:hypothetical protein|uniref:Uncharacterized protein n=1 Tax=Fusobacterium vincentii 3_1_36A2 TaxID=469604 RepID=C7XPL0_FUSVC|nr:MULTISPECIES: hypothetical protein [Fusobacterium]EEU32753.1 hypothetical protein HMPREF0946_00826 [Fusobacterium vincentii 3_1_36A2]DAI43589.1 MAG TPA: protein of unknown function (DUF5016) [Caudoviricetes sp.]